MKITKKYLTLNQYSRPHSLCHPKGVIVHYTGFSGQTAEQCWKYFESLKNQNHTSGIYASTQFIVGLDGEIIQTMEENEMAYGVSTPVDYSKTPYPQKVEKVFGKSVNKNALHIEMCFDDKDGKINEKTLEATTRLVADILNRYSLPITCLFTHNECTGKLCPKYFVENKKAYSSFKKGVERLLKNSSAGLSDIEILEG
jgi:N-acetylmuramoyl-L-alanine amidase